MCENDRGECEFVLLEEVNWNPGFSHGDLCAIVYARGVLLLVSSLGFRGRSISKQCVDCQGDHDFVWVF
jgi:hypothetical protein